MITDVQVHLWEPNRHLELVCLAQAWQLTSDMRYLEGIGTLLESWFVQCPYGLGPNWSSALEAGIRLINWSIALMPGGGSLVGGFFRISRPSTISA